MSASARAPPVAAAAGVFSTKSTTQTRLLEKRRQMFEVEEALEAQKVEFARREEVLGRREESLRKKDEELAGAFTRFQTVVAENENKRMRASKKASEEESAATTKVADIADAQRQLAELKAEVTTLHTRRQKYERYAQFLEACQRANPGEFVELKHIVERYEILYTSRVDVLQDKHRLSAAVEEQRHLLAKVTKAAETQALTTENTLAKLKKRLEAARGTVMSLQQGLDDASSAHGARLLEIGQVLASVSNLHSRCLVAASSYSAAAAAAAKNAAAGASGSSSGGAAAAAGPTATSSGASGGAAAASTAAAPAAASGAAAAAGVTGSAVAPSSPLTAAAAIAAAAAAASGGGGGGPTIKHTIADGEILGFPPFLGDGSGGGIFSGGSGGGGGGSALSPLAATAEALEATAAASGGTRSRGATGGGGSNSSGAADGIVGVDPGAATEAMGLGLATSAEHLQSAGAVELRERLRLAVARLHVVASYVQDFAAIAAGYPTWLAEQRRTLTEKEAAVIAESNRLRAAEAAKHGLLKSARKGFEADSDGGGEGASRAAAGASGVSPTRPAPSGAAAGGGRRGSVTGKVPGAGGVSPSASVSSPPGTTAGSVAGGGGGGGGLTSPLLAGASSVSAGGTGISMGAGAMTQAPSMFTTRTGARVFVVKNLTVQGPPGAAAAAGSGGGAAAGGSGGGGGGMSSPGASVGSGLSALLDSRYMSTSTGGGGGTGGAGMRIGAAGGGPVLERMKSLSLSARLGSSGHRW